MSLKVLPKTRFQQFLEEQRVREEEEKKVEWIAKNKKQKVDTQPKRDSAALFIENGWQVLHSPNLVCLHAKNDTCGPNLTIVPSAIKNSPSKALRILLNNEVLSIIVDSINRVMVTKNQQRRCF